MQPSNKSCYNKPCSLTEQQEWVLVTWSCDLTRTGKSLDLTLSCMLAKSWTKGADYVKAVKSFNNNIKENINISIKKKEF